MSYLKNIGKSAAFAFPQTVKGKLDNLFGMGGQLTSADNREAIVSHFKDTRAILKDTYQETVTTGYNDAINAIKTGDFTEKEEKFDFELDGDDFGFDNFDDILGDDKSTPVNVTNNIEVTTSKEPTKGDAIVAQTISNSSGAIANKLSDVARTTAGMGEIATNLSRHQLVNQVGEHRAAVSFYNAAIQHSDRDYKFRESIQKKFYEQNISSLFTITQFVGELSDKMSRLIEGQKVVATATDLTTKIQESRNNPTANFSEMFDNNGGFDISGYMSVMNKRLKNMIEEKTSMASMFSMSTVAEMAIETAFPKGFSARMEKLNDYIGDLPAVLLTKLSSDGKQLQANEDSNPMTKMAGKLMEFFGAEISSGKQLDLGNYAKSQAVAFDGYSHRSLVEVIPTLLGDILGEVSAIGRSMGTVTPKGIKAYNYSTGVFVDTAQERQKLEASLQKRSLQGFELAALERGADPTAQMNSLFDKMVTEGFSYTGKNADERLEKLVNETVDPAKLAELTEGLAQYRELLKNTEDKNQLRYDINAAIIKGANVRTKGMHDILSSGEENIARFIYNSDGSNTVVGGNDFANAAEANRQRQLNGEAERGTGGARYGTVGSITESMNNFRTIQQEEQSKDQISKGGIFTNEDGNVTLKSIYQSPFKMAGRTADGARKLINNFIFGKEDETGERVSLIQRIKDGFFGDNGIFSGFIERVGNNSTVKSIKDKFNNLRTTLFGDDESEGLIKKKLRKAHGVFGAVFASVFPMDKLKDLATSAVTKFANYIGVSDSDISSAGGLVGYFKKSIKSKLDSAGTYLFGTDDGEGGRTGGLFDSMYKKGQESLQYVSDNILAPLKEKLSNVFDTVKTKLNTAFEGIKVHFNSIFESLKTNLGNMFNGLKEYSKELFTDISENVLAPLKVKLIDAFDIVKAKGASVFENVKETLMENIFSPLKLAMFGEDGKSGFIGNFTNQFKEKLFNPFKERVGEIYNAAKSNIMDGFITPMKDALIGKLANSEGVRGIFGVVGDKMQAGVDYITDAFREKIFEPFSNFMTNPVTGMLPKINNFLFNKDTGIFSSFSNYLFDEDKGIFTRLNKTLFTGEDSYMGRLQHWLNNPTDGVLTNLFDKLNANTEIVKEHMKRIGADLNENIIQPIKKEMKIVWDFTKDYFMNEIMTPLKHEIKGMYHDAVTFMKKEVFEPLKGTLQPFIEEAKYQWRMMKTHFADILKSSGKSIGQAINESFILGFGKSFTDIMRDNVLDPIKDVLGSVKKFLVTSLGAMIKIPVNIIKETSNSLRERHKALGIEYKAKQPRSESDIAASTERAKAREERAEARKKANEERKVARLEARGLRAAAKAEEEKADKKTRQSSTGRNVKDKNTKGKGISQDPVISNVKIQIDRLKGSSKGTISNIVEKTSESTSYLKRLYTHFTSPKHTTLNIKSSKSSSNNNLSGGLQEAVDQIKGKAKFAPATIAGISDNAHTINNTSKDIYQFITSNLQNVGFNTERMAIALGANLKGTAEKAHGKGLLGKLKSFIRSPISFITNIGKTLISGIANVATNIIKLPLTILKNSVNAISSILTAAADVFTTTIKSIGTVASGIASVIQETGKIAGKLLVGLTHAITPVIKAIGEATKTVSSILIHVTTEFTKGVAEAGSVIIKSAGSMFASLSKNLFSIGKDIIHAGGVVAKHLLSVGTEIVKMGAQIMKGIAKTAGSLIGSTLSAVTGGLRGGGRGSLVGALTPVYVVGGRLAGTDGGASSFAEAKMGFNRKSGKYKAIKDNIVESKLFENMTEYKEKLLRGVNNTSKSIKSLGGTIKKMALALGGGLSTVMTGLTGLSSAIPAILNNIPGAGMVKAGNAAVQGAVGGAVSNLIGRIKANPAAILPKLKTALKAAGFGLIGLGINSIADKYLEEGTAKEVVKTGGGALQGAALGATVGSFIPVIGTAIGAVVGGIGGALYENKDHILKWAEDSGFIDDLKNDWKIIKTKGAELAEATANGMEWFAQKGIDWTNEAIENDKKLIADLKNDWKIIKTQSNKLMTFISDDWDKFKNEVTNTIDITKDTWNRYSAAISKDWNRFVDYVPTTDTYIGIANDWDKFKGDITKALDITKDTWSKFSDAVVNDWDKFKGDIATAVDATKDIWSKFSDAVANDWSKFKDEVAVTADITKKMWNSISDAVADDWNKFKDEVANSELYIKISEGWDNIFNNVSNKLTTIKEKIAPLFDATREYAKSAWSSVSVFASDAWKRTTDLAAEMWKGIGKSASKVWDDIGNTAKGVWDKIAGWWPFGGTSGSGKGGNNNSWFTNAKNLITSSATYQELAKDISNKPSKPTKPTKTAAKPNTIPVTLAKPTNTPPTKSNTGGWGLKFPIGNSLVSNSNTSNYSGTSLGNSLVSNYSGTSLDNSNTNTDYSSIGTSLGNNFTNNSNTNNKLGNNLVSNYSSTNLGNNLINNNRNSNTSLGNNFTNTDYSSIVTRLGNNFTNNNSNTDNYSGTSLGNNLVSNFANTNTNSNTDYSIGASEWDSKYPSSTKPLSTYSSNFVDSNLSSALTSNFSNSNESMLISNFSNDSGRAGIGDVISEKASSVKNTISNKIHGANKASGGNYSQAPQSQGNGYVANRDLISYAAQASGVPLDLMLQIAAVESDFVPRAGAKTSSAKGLYQFIDDTWGDVKRKYGKKFGIPNNAHQHDPVANALLGGAFLRENSEGITTIKDNANSTDLYLAHFLGLGGAKRFLRGLNDNPEQDARKLVKGDIPGANKSIFFDNGKPRTARGVYEDLANRVKLKAEQHGLATPDGNGYVPGGGSGGKSDDGGLFGILGAMGSAVLSPIKAVTSGISGMISGAMKAITKTSDIESVDEYTDMEYDGADGTPINRSTLGKFADGGAGTEYIRFGKKSVSLDGIQSDTKNRFVAMAQAYHAQTGNKLQVNSGYRSFKQQERLYKTMPAGKAARPGRSMHNYGYALDVQSAHANVLANSGLLAKFGFHRPVSGEAWHVEDATINRNAVRKRGMELYANGKSPEPIDNAQRNGESEGVAVGGKGFMPSNSMGLSSSFSPTNGLYSKYYDDGTEQAPTRSDTPNNGNNNTTGVSTDNNSPMGKINPFINFAKDITGLFSKDKSKRPDIASVISSGSASILTIMDMLNGELSMNKDYQNPNGTDNKPYTIPEVGVSTADKMMYPDLYAGRKIDPNLDKIEANQTVGVQSNNYQSSAIDTDRTTNRLNPLPLVSTMTDTSAMENSSNAELKNMIGDLQRYLVANSNNTTLETNNTNNTRSNNKELSELDLLTIIADKISVLASGNSAKVESNPNINKTTQRLSRDNSASLFNISANSLMVAAQS